MQITAAFTTCCTGNTCRCQKSVLVRSTTLYKYLVFCSTGGSFYQFEIQCQRHFRQEALIADSGQWPHLIKLCFFFFFSNRFHNIGGGVISNVCSIPHKTFQQFILFIHMYKVYIPHFETQNRV